MNIVVLGKYYPPYCGGIETLTRLWCEGFVRRGATVDCVVANDRPWPARETMHGVRVHRCARFGRPLSQPLCPGYLLAGRRPADVFHLQFPNPLADLAVWLAARHVPLVVSYHSDIVRQAKVLGFYRPLLRWLLRRAARVVVATPPQLEHAPLLRDVRPKCDIIPFGLDLQRFLEPTVEPPAVARARAEAAGRPILVNLGRLVPYKGQRYLIEALREVDAVAWIVGTGPLRESLESLAVEAGVRDRVRFWGEVDDALVPALLHAGDIFVLPSITPNEAFGLVQVEAMACGRPVICCDLPSGVPYVNQDGVTGLVVPPADARALAAAAKKLCARADLRASMGMAGRERARREFTLETMIDRYWRLFETVSRASGTR